MTKLETQIALDILEHSKRKIGLISPEKRGLRITKREQYITLQLGKFEIWDDSDLELIRETIKQLIKYQDCKAIGINMSYVKSIPTGFFGMLFDFHDKDHVEVRIFNPQAEVATMLWFRKFFEQSPIEADVYILLEEPKNYVMPGTPDDWQNEAGMSPEEIEMAKASSRIVSQLLNKPQSD